MHTHDEEHDACMQEMLLMSCEIFIINNNKS